MAGGSPYLLEDAAFRAFITGDEAFRSWYSANQATPLNETHGLFVSAHTFGMARIELTSSILIEDDANATEANERFEEFFRSALRRRILPVNAEVMNNVVAAFHSLETLLKQQAEDGDEFTFPIDALIEFATSIQWNATLLVWPGDSDKAKIFAELKSKYSDFQWVTP